MTQLELELNEVKNEVGNMWALVTSQLNKARESILHFDKDLAREVMQREKRVNAYELKIDRDCENIFALYCPVAIDLRFLLAALKINNNLERIGDIADGIARYVIDAPAPFPKPLMEATELLKMFQDSIDVMRDAKSSFESEDTVLARTIFEKDEVLDRFNLSANHKIAEVIKKDINLTTEAMYVLSIIRKLERVGDQCTNIAEEIIFYIEAKVLKHTPQK
ncbi:phosphate signaling complex protein PhoU [Dinghuibacter silviterrae]|uniref:Phosphate-specific transport system accessory protein PhoU n=1 Tax=Dinghuibacter silviterrae TaxID=1539049 RepID=A0A4R8DVD3_9BACT|nr:phosphate signaling complex protein PhoU [Dinghuibacter silviterrae]TDX01878.1 phosphate transport system protein [Dinghuibacter silviterrae]